MEFPTFSQLRKSAKNIDPQTTIAKIVVLGDCATQHIAKSIEGYSFYVNYPLHVIDTDYNQITAQVFDANSDLYREAPKYVLVFMCSEMLKSAFDTFPNKKGFADYYYKNIVNIWDTICTKTNSVILQTTFIENDDAVFGNYALKTKESFLYQVKKLNFLLCEGAQENKGVYLVDINKIASNIGYSNLHDSKMYYMAKLPFKTDSLPIIAKAVLDVVCAVGGRFKKCVITDLDNTLWGGVIGDDGMSGIEIGDLGSGHAFDDLQHWLKSLRERGIILAICSKNEEDTAKEPFLNHPDMVLSLKDISLFVANWKDKASNIRYIQQTLNIGMDSIVFIDDNPFERDQVRTSIPEITVPELPEDPSQYLDYLKSLNLFETASFSETDKSRTQQYQTQIARTTFEKSFSDYSEYLKSLEMVAESKSFDDFHCPRISQLTQRSNQFNLRTVRCSEADIGRYASDSNYITRYYTLKDKFGDYGLISVLIMKKEASDTLFIENWLMSCRVLKRGMEEFVINDIATIAKSLGIKHVKGEYIPTPKNAMVKNLYGNLGFQQTGGGNFLLVVDEYMNQETFIKNKL